MDVEATTPLAAFVAGLSTSLHCSLMCGPLACAVQARPLTYHASRLVSYTLAGALCGGLGAMVAGFLRGDLARFTPWALALVLVFMALGPPRVGLLFFSTDSGSGTRWAGSPRSFPAVRSGSCSESPQWPAAPGPGPG